MFGIIDEFGEKNLIANGITIPIIVIALVVIIGFYLLRSFGLYSLAKKSEDGKIRKIFYFAFIPFLWVYLAGKLAGNISFFGFNVKNFVLIITIAFVVSGVLNLVYNVYCYYPLVKYIFSGKPVFLNLSNYASENAYYFNDMFVLEENLGISLSNGVIKTLNTLSLVFELLQAIAEIGLIFIYVELFRKYWPRHVFAGSIFSIFGLFPVFIFAVRKNSPVKYNEYIYNQYRNMYNNQNPNGNYNNYNNNQNPNDDPFADYSKKQNNNFNNNYGNSNKSEEDPFSEFSDKNK
ncbi:MAG: hypothetical protein KBS91_04315 [Firmicutes bacterium]|nr:hypothetical protein [Candidatus Caballimonas caccae]